MCHETEFLSVCSENSSLREAIQWQTLQGKFENILRSIGKEWKSLNRVEKQLDASNFLGTRNTNNWPLLVYDSILSKSNGNAILVSLIKYYNLEVKNNYYSC